MKFILYLILILVFIPLPIMANIDSTAVSYFYAAKQRLENMLTGNEKMSYEEAIYEIENAWWEGGVDHDSYKEIMDLHVKNIMNLYESMKDSSHMNPSRDLL